MSDSNFVFEQGEPIEVGTHGETDFVFHEGDPVPNTGRSDFVFEAGVGLGGASLVFDGTEIGFYDTGLSQSDWAARRDNAPNMYEWVNQGYDELSGKYRTYVFGHYSSVDDTYAIAFWHRDDAGTDVGLDIKMQIQNTGLLDSVVQADGPVDQSAEDDVYDISGDPWIAQHQAGWDAGDGICLLLNSGASGTITFYKESRTDDGRDFSSQPFGSYKEADAWRVHGPENTLEKSGGLGTQVDLEVSV